MLKRISSSTNVKRVLSLLLAVTLLFGAAPLNGFVGLELPKLSALFAPVVHAADPTSGTCGANLTWSYNTSTKTLTISGTGAMYSYDDYYNGTYLTTAPWRPYYNTMQTLVINSGVTSIGWYAFYGCTGLTSVTIGNSVTYISGFEYCTGLTSVTIPDSVTSIGQSAFYNCTGLTSVTIPDSVTNIDGWAFSGCTGLTSVTIPDSVTSIGFDAFYKCTGLTSVTIPDSVTSIGEYAFNNTAYYNDSANWENNVLYIGNYLIEAQESVSGAYEIKPGTKCIGNFAFRDCTDLTSVTIPDSVTSIGDSAFNGCTGLTSVTIPDSVTSIGRKAFSGCTGLTSVTIPASVTSIDWYAFRNCTGLTSVTIGNSVTRIGGYAFEDCTGLTSVTIGNSVTSIGNGAFWDCTGLTSVTIPNSVTSIGREAFCYCTGLTSVTIPDSVTSIGESAFNGCTKLKDVYYTGSEAQWKKIYIYSYNAPLINATIHYNSSGGQIDPEPPLVTDRIEVMSYNVYVEDSSVKGKTNGITFDCRYSTRLKQVEANIMNNLPDSVGLQEVSKDIKTILENYPDINGKSMGEKYAFAGEFRDKDKLLAYGANNEASLIAYRKDKYNLKDSGTRWLSENGKKYSKHSKAGYLRVFTWALLEDKTTKQQYLHINTHIDHNDEAAEFSVAQIIYFVNHSYPNMPVVLTGDFNHTKSSQMYKNLISAGFVDTNINNDTTKTYTNCYNQGEKIDGVMKAYEPKIIDFIFVRNGFEKGIKDYSVYAEDYSDSAKYGASALPYPYASDHHPIVSSLSLQYRATMITADTVYTTEKGHSSTNKVKFDSKWLGFDNKKYNHELAQFCADFAMMGYTGDVTDTGDSAELKQNLSKFGFNNAEINLKTGQKKDGRDRVNYFISDKKEFINGEEYTVVFAGFIGSNGYQWFSNFDPYGTERQQSYAGNSEKDKVHLGFADARDFAIGLLKTHIDKLGVDRSKIKLILTGHSRGAATANLIAAKILDGKAGLSLYGFNMYTYTFATPNVANNKDSSVNTYAEKYKCIFNIVNPEDFVTKVLLQDWGFARYGITYALPSRTNDSNYKKYRNKLDPLFETYTGAKYEPYRWAEYEVYDLVKSMGKRIDGLNEYYEKDDFYGGGAMFEYFKNALCPFVSQIFDWNTFGAIVASYVSFGTLKRIVTRFFLANQVEHQYFEKAHQQETYCAYMHTLSSSQLTEYRAAYKESFNCPVDVEVYDLDTDELVGKIVNNTVDETVAAKEDAIVASVEGDSKEFWLPSNGNYSIVITGNDNGTMDYSVSEIDSDFGEVRRDNFFDVPVQGGVSMTADFSEAFMDLDNLCLTLSDGTELAPTEHIEVDAKEYQIDVNVIGEGFATESKKAISGDYVTLSAESKNGAEFLGWYENGKLISSEAELSFVAKANRNLTAKFTVVTEPTTLSKIAVKDMPAKTTYTVGDSFDSTGLTLTATYSDNSTKTIVSGFTCSGFSSTTAGTKTVTVAYEGKTTTFTVAVVDKIYTLTYDANGGSGAPASQTGNGWIKLSDVELTKEGYIFRGWATRPDLDPEIDGSYYGIGVHFNLTADTTLYAVWRKAKVRSVSLSDITVNYKSSTTLKPSVTDEGVKYTAQYESSNPSVVSVDNRGKVTGMKRGSATITVTVMDEYGNIEKDTCTVTVRYSLIQWIIIILLFGWLWY